ncbi:MAG: RES family NAD+ phosphorylase [Bacteroidota bacterium]
MLLYRLGKTEYIKDLQGEGCLYGDGRWHLQGTRVLYTSGSASLAKLEVLANSPVLPKGRSLMTMSIPDDTPMLWIETDQLPLNWSDYPYNALLPMIAKDWIDKGEYWIMRVPSAQLPIEYNYLLNPLHPDHSKLVIVSIVPHPFDPRLKEEKPAQKKRPPKRGSVSFG